MENRSIALDGPAGAGKSTLAKKAAEHFGLIYVDTGALYRCIGLHALRGGIRSNDIESVSRALSEIHLEMDYDGSGVQRMFLCGNDVTDEIRLPEVSGYASDVSALPPVREYLLAMQREMAVKYNVIMDGRDIGTVVLPDAGLKIFITAKLEIRARRRYDELRQKGIEAAYDDVLREMAVRDKNDSEREIAPLKAARGSVLLDTTEMDFEESFTAITNIITEALGGVL